MKRFRYGVDPLCVLACAAYAVNRLWVRGAVDWVVLRSWFDDFWLIPAALPWLLWLWRRCGLRGDDGVPRWGEITALWALWSVQFEWLGPHFFHHATGDAGDVLAYAAGAAGAGLWWHRGGA